MRQILADLKAKLQSANEYFSEAQVLADLQQINKCL